MALVHANVGGNYANTSQGAVGLSQSHTSGSAIGRSESLTERLAEVRQQLSHIESLLASIQRSLG